ncbi:MAG: hypothetical protein AVDCRST_MAG56-6419 [uncultured Cytophagales bacterium]|uniref:NAD(P)-binding domain-containing protein n=1 Tax=uncultured Cytophagales bacterium TaxID=158755 RepID=A0A6J4KXD8_9SPHI|nr:MAG: hypothetical protein AVDCRST_MAG56-6419 [uncultured Cytophagales bacterium]
MNANVKVLVIGATGMAGRVVVTQLDQAAVPVRALVRDVPKARRLFPASVELRQGDAFDEATLQKALEGVSHVYFHPAATLSRSEARSMDRVGTRLLVKHLPATAHLIKLSEIGAGPNPSFHDIDCKYRSELDIRERLTSWTILRPTWFMESIPFLLTMGPVSVCFGGQPGPIWWLSCQDYALTVLACVQKPAVSQNRVFTLQGPEAYPMLDALRLFNREARTGKGSLRLPLGLLTLPARWSEQFRFNQQIMHYYNGRRETFESEPAHRLLHQPALTLAAFARRFHPPARGGTL